MVRSVYALQLLCFASQHIKKAEPLENTHVHARIQALNARLPVRYGFLALCAFAFLLALFRQVVFQVGWLAPLVFGALVTVGVQDLGQTRHAILRNYPVIGHLQFFV